MPKGVPGSSKDDYHAPRIAYSAPKVTLGAKIKELRMHMKPYMTQDHLRIAARVSYQAIHNLEGKRERSIVLTMEQIHKIADALNHDVYVKFVPKWKPSRDEEPSPDLSDKLRPLSRHAHRTSGVALWRAAMNGHFPSKSYHRELIRRQRQARVDIENNVVTKDTQNSVLLAMHLGTISPETGIPKAPKKSRRQGQHQSDPK